MKNWLVLIILSVFVFSCAEQTDETEILESTLKRMPFNERVFLLNSVGNESRIYEVDYDFQGLGESAVLTRLETDVTIPNGGHMTMSPDNEWLTVVVASISKIFLVNVNSGAVRELGLYNFNPNGMHYDEHYNNKVFKGQITQVDVDQEGYLFIAGKSGFFKVVADNGNGKVDPSFVNEGGDIWNDTDPSLCQSANAHLGECGAVWVHAVPFTFSGDNYVESIEDGEDYFEDLTAFNPKKVQFLGGDILFTQNSDETDGFEQQRLLSFSQWQGNTAIALDLNWDWDNHVISFNASKVFGGSGHKFHKNKTERVTGAALTGDNYVLTSHHKKNYLNLWNLTGDLIQKVSFTINDASAADLFSDKKAVHFWGDMASTQSFDVNSDNPEGINSREINGEYFSQWYRGANANHQYAEVKLYRPGMSAEQYEVADLSDDNYNVSKESRRNSANADLVDHKKNGTKFVSLGKNSGYVLMKFPSAVAVTENTTLQVVETTWDKKAQYETIASAFAAYKEKATVHVLVGETPRYYSNGLEDNANWVEVGLASIANNEFSLSGLAGEQIQWIKITDDYSTTPDGFDVNFVSIYDGE